MSPQVLGQALIRRVRLRMATKSLGLMRGGHPHAAYFSSFRACPPQWPHRHYGTTHLADEEFAARPHIDRLNLM